MQHSKVPDRPAKRSGGGPVDFARPAKRTAYLKKINGATDVIKTPYLNSSALKLILLLEIWN